MIKSNFLKKIKKNPKKMCFKQLCKKEGRGVGGETFQFYT